MRCSNPYVNRVSIGSKTSLSCGSWGGRSFLGTLSAALSPYERRTSSGPGILFPPTPLSYASIIRDMRAREKMWPVLFKRNLFILSFQSCEGHNHKTTPPKLRSQESALCPKAFSAEWGIRIGRVVRAGLSARPFVDNGMHLSYCPRCKRKRKCKCNCKWVLWSI